MTTTLALPDRPRILVIALRRLGDVLLTTPLVRSLRRGFPGARIDMLVFAGTEDILAGNPDIDGIVTAKPRAIVVENLALLRRIGRRYDLALSTQTGDRPTLLAVMAAGRRVGFVPPAGGGRWWKERALHHAVPADPRNHRVAELLRLAGALGIEVHDEVVCPGEAHIGRCASRGRYAVIHASPMFRYKRWSDASWHALAFGLVKRGLTVVATGSADPQERAYLDKLWAGHSVERLDGHLDWRELTTLLKHATLYVGADTSVTHLAAAAGCPTVALFGPSDPRLWGPWPAEGLHEIWQAAEPVQRRGNVRLVQHVHPCTPCQKEGCERHLDSHSACLDDLTAGQVLAAADEALADVTPNLRKRA
jgi:heptosyltransferase-3